MIFQVIWSSCQRLSCASAQTPIVVLCLTSENLVAPLICANATDAGFAFTTIEGTLVKTWRDDTPCGNGSFRYLIKYDSTDLANPNVPLTPAQISGVFCKGCITQWVENKVGGEITLVDNGDGTLTLTTQHGCEYVFTGTMP